MYRAPFSASFATPMMTISITVTYEQYYSMASFQNCLALMAM